MGQKQLGSKAVMVEAEEEEVGCPGDLEGEGKEEVKTVGKEHLPRTKGYDGCFLVWLCSYLPGTMWVNTGGGGGCFLHVGLWYLLLPRRHQQGGK